VLFVGAERGIGLALVCCKFELDHSHSASSLNMVNTWMLTCFGAT